MVLRKWMGAEDFFSKINGKEVEDED